MHVRNSTPHKYITYHTCMYFEIMNINAIVTFNAHCTTLSTEALGGGTVKCACNLSSDFIVNLYHCH